MNEARPQARAEQALAERATADLAQAIDVAVAREAGHLTSVAQDPALGAISMMMGLLGE